MSLIGKIRLLATLGQGVLKGIPEAWDESAPDPIELFATWFEAAHDAGLLMPEAMALSTATPEGMPSSRMVLLKHVDDEGFVFYTNFGSRKAHELDRNPRAALLFYWGSLERQVRVEGHAERVSEREAADYFATRARGSQIGAWASRQSEPLESRETLERRAAEARERFAGEEVPLPSFWGGYRLVPDALEFWQGRANRLHDRLRYERSDAGWTSSRLYP